MNGPAGRPEAQAGGTRPPQQPAAGTPGGREPEGPSSGAGAKCAGRCGATGGNIRIKRWRLCCMHLQSRPDFYRFGADGERLFCGVSGAKRPACPGRGKRNLPWFWLFPKARYFLDGIRRKTAVPSCLSNENFPRHPINCCFFGIL